ncbi:MAG: tetratricopeptide repeat protein [Spirochaetales bacterium]|jgi:tetratricopeptide (TPR) repeat protein|nr:tetratricopeptide repeat protein [Spirochaetales bacterium]
MNPLLPAALGLVLALSLASCASGGLSRKEEGRLYYSLGQAYDELGRFSDAAAAYERAFQSDRSLFSAGYNLVRIHLAAGRVSQGKALLQEFLALDPDNTVLLEAAAWAEYLDGDGEAALGIYRRILELKPQDSTALYNISRIYLQREDHGPAVEALRALTQAPELAPGIPERAFLLCETAFLETLRGNDGAARDILLALDSQSLSPPVKLRVFELLGDIYSRQELFTEALGAYDQIADSDPPPAEILYKKAVIYLTAIDDSEGGLALLSRALEAGFDREEAFRELLARSDLGDPRGVRALLREKGLEPSAGVSEPPA